MNFGEREYLGFRCHECNGSRHPLQDWVTFGYLPFLLDRVRRGVSVAT